MRKIIRITIFVLAALMLLVSCAEKSPVGSSASDSAAQSSSVSGSAAQSSSASGSAEPASSEAVSMGRYSNISEVNFSYEKDYGSKFELTAYVDITADGAKVELKKRVGEMNYTGHVKQDVISLSKEQASELVSILGKYDLKAFSEVRTRGYGYSPTRSVYIGCGEESYYVPWDGVFPEGTPPEIDVFYFELFNFFNDIINDLPGWEEVRSDNLPDPREDPIYTERTVEWYGRTVRLVPGTGYKESGTDRGSEIDYNGADWWTEEGFVGTWRLDPEGSDIDESMVLEVSNGELTVTETGEVTLTLDDEVWTGNLSAKRYYMEDIGLRLEKDDGYRTFTVSPDSYSDYESLRISSYPGPVPEPQFAPIDLKLIKE